MELIWARTLEAKLPTVEFSGLTANSISVKKNGNGKLQEVAQSELVLAARSIRLIMVFRVLGVFGLDLAQFKWA